MHEEFVNVFVSAVTNKKFWLIEFFDENEIPYKISFNEFSCDNDSTGAVYDDLQYYWVEKQHEQDVLDFIEGYKAEVSFDEDSFDEDFFEELDDAEFSEEYGTLSEVDIERFLDNADISYAVKSDHEVRKTLKKLYKSIASDIDYVSYEGGRSVKASKEIVINETDFFMELEINRDSDDSPFEVVCRLIKN